MMRSFFLRLLVPHLLLFVGLGARDLAMPYDPEQYRTRHVKVENERYKYPEEIERERQEQIAENHRRMNGEMTLVVGRGVTGSGGVGLAWALTLTLCGFFQGRTAPAREQSGEEPHPAAIVTVRLLCFALGMCIGSAPWWVVGLVNLGALFLASPWLFLLFRKHVVPEMADEWRRRDEERRRRREARARREVMHRQIARINADMENLRSSALDPDMIEDEILRLRQRKRDLETELELFDARGE